MQIIKWIFKQKQRLTRKIFKLKVSTPNIIKNMNDISNVDIK